MAVVDLQVDAGVASITLNHPESLNALDYELAVDLNACLQTVANDASVRSVVLGGAGGHFIAGGDIAYFNAKLQGDGEVKEAVGPMFEHVHGSIQTLRTMPQPVVASVEGACAGLGVSLMAACDLALAADNSKFTLAYCHLGVSPDGGSTWGLPRTLGSKRAAELVFLGDRFDVARLRDWTGQSGSAAG